MKKVYNDIYMAGYIHKRGSSDNGNPTGVAGTREGRRSQSWAVMGERR